MVGGLRFLSAGNMTLKKELYNTPPQQPPVFASRYNDNLGLGHAILAMVVLHIAYLNIWLAEDPKAGAS